ncbi:MAG: hypothetical protein U9Q62_02240 [Campylobacterota bacterium]|nr:hypothetical protein [Campylobacterota bacterium]
MKINIEDYLYQLDQAFAEKEDKEIYMIFVLIAGGLVFLSYYFLWDSAKLGYDQALKESQSLEKKILADQNYLRTHPESMIVQIENQTKAIEAKFLEFQDSNAYIKYQIEQISELYYDEQAWGEYIDSVSENAKKYKIKIVEYSNAFATNKEAFGHVLDINVKSYGSFHNLVKYINSLEQSFLVVDIHQFAITTEERLNADLQISVWGITY